MEAKQTQYTNLDFDDVKESIINRIKQDRTFSGANFEGSGLNIIADILAYVNHMTNVTANISANEMFLDSAQLRQSVVSKAKELGYRPFSMVTPKARVRLTFSVDQNIVRERVVIPAGTKFLSTQKNSFFSTIEEKTAVPTTVENGNTIFTTDIDIYEGYFNTFTYTIDSSDTDQRFYVPSNRVDVSTLSVKIIPYNTTEVIQLKENDNINALNPESLVYFLHQNPDDFFEVTLGDGVLGRKFNDGDKVILSYVVTNKGEEMNGANDFEKTVPIDGIRSYTITTLSPAQGGHPQETIDQIRYRVNKMFKAQNRAVIKEDYNALMLSQYPWIDSITTWGGQYNDPPQFGKVFFAIKPKHTEILSSNLKEYIKNDLIKKYNVITVIPEIVDPDYIYVSVQTDIKYNAHKTTKSNTELISEVIARIEKYFKDTVEDFNAPLYFSPLATVIDGTDPTFMSNVTTLQLHKNIYPDVRPKSIPDTFHIEFSNPIVPGSLTSSFFNSGNSSVYVKSLLKDDGKGNISMFSYASEDSTKPLIPDVGTVDYATGVVDLEFQAYSLPSHNSIKVYVTPTKKDIYQINKQIILKNKDVPDSFWGVKTGTYVHLDPLPIVER